MSTKKIRTDKGIIGLFALLIISVVLLFLAGTILREEISQTIFFIAGMVLLWYSAHPLSHSLSARAFGIKTMYFYLGKSGMRKLKTPISRLMNSRYVITVGTKLDREKMERIQSSRDRAFIMGSGAIVSTVLSALVLLYGVLTNFGYLALILGGLFFAVNLATEFLYSTKVGDLKKMRDELDKRR